MKPALPKDPKEFLETVTFQYRKFIENLQTKITSGKLTEKQKIKVFFYIKKEEVHNMIPHDLRRAKKKYEQTLSTIEKTISFLEQKKYTRFLLVQPKKIKERIALEKTARTSCKELVAHIDKQLLKR